MSVPLYLFVYVCESIPAWLCAFVCLYQSFICLTVFYSVCFSSSLCLPPVRLYLFVYVCVSIHAWFCAFVCLYQSFFILLSVTPSASLSLSVSSSLPPSLLPLPHTFRSEDSQTRVTLPFLDYETPFVAQISG